MAGNVSAFSAVWTYDIYQPLINKNAPDEHYVAVGRWATILGVIISIGTAYLVMNAAGIMDYVQALFSFFISPLLGVVLMGMFWKRATKAGGFWGLLIGTLTSIGLWAWVKFDPSALRYVALLAGCQRHGREHVSRPVVGDRLRSSSMSWSASLRKPQPLAELDGAGLWRDQAAREEPVPFYKNEWFWTVIAIVCFLALNIYFW